MSNHNSNISTPWNSSNSVKKAVDFTTPAKNRRKISTYKIFEFSDQKVYGFGLQDTPPRIDLLCMKNWGTQWTIEISSNEKLAPMAIAKITGGHFGAAS